MIKGYQQKVSYKGLSFTVDTVDMGMDNPMLVSSALFEGVEIASEKIPYDDIIKFERLEQVLEMLMKELNQKVQTQLLDGYYDSFIEKQFHKKSDTELTPVEAVHMIVIPFIEERFGSTIADRIKNDLLSGLTHASDSPLDFFTKTCKEILAYRIGSTSIFPLMFGEHTETLLKEWIDEFNTLTYTSFTTSELSAVNAIYKYVLPDLQNQIGKYMTFKLWDSVEGTKVQQYEGLEESAKFLKLCQAMLSHVAGFYSSEELEEKARNWYEQAYPHKHEVSPKSSASAADAVRKIVHPDIEQLLGKYMADRLMLEAIERIPSTSRFEHGKYVDMISTILSNELVTNLCDDHWIEKRRKEWIDSFEQISSRQESIHNLS